jgi:hypothetical protein
VNDVTYNLCDISDSLGRCLKKVHSRKHPSLPSGADLLRSD